MIPDYGEKIYEILSELIGLKFKAQIKDSGIEFKKIYRVTDLESNAEYHSLIINDKQINFKNKAEFLKEFVLLLQNNINEFDRRFEELQKTSNDRWIDENQIYMEHEEIGHFGSKQSKLLKKMRDYE
jgi:hypothetical protein